MAFQASRRRLCRKNRDRRCDFEATLQMCRLARQQTRFTGCHSLTLNDPELQHVVQAWEILPEPMKKAIVAMIVAYQGSGDYSSPQ